MAGATDREDALERARLARICARITGDRSAAEDLAQETLIEAWRNRAKLRDPAGRDRWLAAIARHVCRRWLCERGRDQARLRRAGLADPLERADDDPLETGLERAELARLLDRAMGLLPSATRRALVERFVHEAPHATIAARLGISEDAAAMRLTRGKAQLRRLLAGELRDEATALGLVAPAGDRWEETRVWCPKCGARRLLGRFERPGGLLSYRCPDCHPAPGDTSSDFRLANPRYAALLGEVERYKPALNRTLAWADGYYRGGLEAGVVACTNCGRPTPLHRMPPAPVTAGADPWPRLTVDCAACGEQASSSLGGLVLALPAVRRFWRDHPRMRALPEREVAVGGRPALVSRLESVAGGAWLDIVSDRETYAVLARHGDAQADTPPTGSA